ncbi:unnamed protein product [Schistocephalus solidus]|uniref:Uncharacterized protein n=1 Tax=Schistocephalus solidus TaxID=70667 RepID=A0A183TSB5_SCHSO|nr:unnamed protein product [Schistocephalus solidus]
MAPLTPKPGGGGGESAADAANVHCTLDLVGGPRWTTVDLGGPRRWTSVDHGGPRRNRPAILFLLCTAAYLRKSVLEVPAIRTLLLQEPLVINR